MADGSKSTDHQVPAKKKRGSSKKKATQDKTGGKRKSVMDKSMRSEKNAGTGKKGKQVKKGAAASGTKKTDDDLDIESDG